MHTWVDYTITEVAERKMVLFIIEAHEKVETEQFAEGLVKALNERHQLRGMPQRRLILLSDDDIDLGKAVDAAIRSITGAHKVVRVSSREIDVTCQHGHTWRARVFVAEFLRAAVGDA